MRRAAALGCSLPHLWIDPRICAHGSRAHSRSLAFESNRSAGGGGNIGDGNCAFGFREFRAAAHAGAISWNEAMATNRRFGVWRTGDPDLDFFMGLGGDQVEVVERIEQEEE